MRYFVLVAENGSTAKAAAEAMVSQSTVSKSILRLERELNLPLFDRQGIHLVLNPAGKEFLQQVRPILTAVKRLPEFVKSRHLPRRKYRINVGAAEAVMSPFLRRFFQLEPQAQVILTDESWIDDCDLSISASPSGREEGSALRQSIQREILSRPLVAEILAVTSKDETLRDLVAHGVGAAFWPSKTWPRPDPERVRLCHLSGVHFTRQIYALLPPERPDLRDTPLLEALVDYFQELDRNEPNIEGNTA